MSIEAMKQALKTFKKIVEGCNVVQNEINLHKDAKTLATLVKKDCFATLDQLEKAIEEAEKKQICVQLSPFDFVTIVMDKEDLVGKPIIWAQWPNEEERNVS